MLRALALVASLVSFAALGAPASSTSSTATLTISRPEAMEPGRLPGGVRPTRQEIALTLDPKKERFEGSVVIDVDVAAPRTVIALHARGLTVSEATVSQGGAAQAARFAVVDAEEGTASLTLARAVVGKATLRMRFSAPFRTDLDGLYRIEHEGEWYAFSQFEALAAREAFPCFDEPGFKIPFSITLTHPTAVKAIGNTRPDNTVDNKDGTTTTKLALTKPLPTYLLAFVVGPVDVVEGAAVAPAFDRAAPLPLRAITVKGQGARTQKALADTKRVVEALERMFEIGYPYDKLDIVAVPDFAAGAMENAGLVTFRDALLFVDDNSDIGILKGSLEVIAHELAHQWFGNLVTMAWWDDLWLNEGFATWCAARIVQQVRPAYDGDFGLRESANWVMGEDSLVSARRIRNPIKNRGDIQNAFDGITYSKGAAVLAMFEEYIDGQKKPGTFLSGVRAYLREKRFANGTTKDFLRAVGAAAGFDVDAAFSTFLDQPGVPLVSAQCVPAADPKGSARIEVTSSRFLPVGSTGDKNRRWDIPFCVSFLDNKNASARACTLLVGGAGALSLPTPACPKTWHPNADGGGYYRFTVPGPALLALAKALPAMTAGERLSFASTLRAGVSAGTTTFKDALAAAEPLVGDAEGSIARTPLSLLHFARDDVFAPTARERAQVNAKLTRLAQVPLNKLGLVARAKDTPQDKERRAQFFATVVDAFGPARAIAIAAGKELWQTGTTKKLAPELWGTAYAAAVADDADVDAFDARLAQTKRETDPRRRSEMLAGLAQTRVLRERALRFVFDDGLRTSELLNGLWAQGHDPVGAPLAFAFLRDQHDAIAAKIPEDWRSGLPGAVDGCSEDVAVALDAFFAPKVKTTPGLDLSLAQALEEIRLCAAKRAAHEASVRAVFR